MIGVRQAVGPAASGLVRDLADAKPGRVASKQPAVTWPGAVLAMQRSAGNAAIARLMRCSGAGVPVVQRGSGKSDEAEARRAMRRAFTYPFWKLPEGRDVRPSTGGAYVMINGIQVRFLADRFLTEEEMTSTGSGSFRHHGIVAGATTTVLYDHLDFDPKSVQTMPLLDGRHVVVDYTEPVLTVAIQVTYRKHAGVRSLAAARRQRSAYGRGRTLQDHEASHVTDAITFIRATGPRLADGRGVDAASFNASLRKYYAAARRIGGDYGAFSQARTDCPGQRNATFCPVNTSPVK